ncbi:MAG TPA: glycosyltransferase family 4 protein [Pyrinomonadaceae bacterium]
MKILITAPSLDENRNVSGISTVVRQIVERGTFDYEHFNAGRADNEQADAKWISKQAFLPVRFFRLLKREKFDAAHINTAFNPLSIARDFVLTQTAKAAGCPVLLHVHGGKFLAVDFENKALAKIAEKMLASAAAVVVLSEIEKDILEKRQPNLNVKVLQNAVTVEDFSPVKSNNKTDSIEKTIIFLGRLHESKGLHEIIEAARILKSERFCFNFKCFGAGDLQDFFVRAMTAVLGDKFYFGGVVAGEKKLQELSKSDIFILPSRYGEGLPMAMLEAMAAGCIIVASKMASVGAAVRNGENGFTIEPGNAAQLVERLRMILADEIDAKKIGENAQKTIAEKFNLRDYIEKLEKIYAEIVARKI